MSHAQDNAQKFPSLPIGRDDASLPVVYHSALDNDFDEWARMCGWTPADLRRASEDALRIRRRDGYIECPSDPGDGAHPPVLTLDLLGGQIVRVYFSLEQQAIVIRGYGWDPSPCDSGFWGGFFTDDGGFRESFYDSSDGGCGTTGEPSCGRADAHPRAGGGDGNDRPRIYVASLSDYNAGTLYGRWIFADQHPDTIEAQIRRMLADSSEPDAEEWAIHDYDGFAGYAVHEFADVGHVSAVATLIAEHGPVFAGLLTHFGGDLEQARDYIECAYNGAYQDVGEYAFTMTQDLYADALKGLPDFIRHNIDWDAIGRDLELGGDIFTVEVAGEVHVFDSHL